MDAGYTRLATFNVYMHENHAFNVDNALRQFEELANCNDKKNFVKTYGNMWYFCMLK